MPRWLDNTLSLPVAVLNGGEVIRTVDDGASKQTTPTALSTFTRSQIVIMGSPTEPPYSVVTDGVADASAGLDAWLTAVLASGGTGYIPAGTYLLSSGVTAALSASAKIIVDSGAKFVAAAGFPAGQRMFLITTGTGSDHVFEWQGGQFDGTQITGDIFSFNAENCARCKIVLDRTTAGADWLTSGSDSHLFIGGARNVHAEIGHALGAKDAGVYVSSSFDGTIGNSCYVTGNFEKCSVGAIVKRQFETWTIDINAVDCLNGAGGGSADSTGGLLVSPGEGAVVRVNALRCERAVFLQAMSGALVFANSRQIGVSISGYTSTSVNAVYLSGASNCLVHANVSGVNPACTKNGNFRAVYCDRRTLDATNYDATDNVCHINAFDVGRGFAEDANSARNVFHLKERTVTTASSTSGTDSFLIFHDTATYGLNLQKAGTTLRSLNTSDSATNTAFRFESDRATPAANDRLIGQWYLSDAVGTQTEFGREEVRAATVTDGAEEGQIRWHVQKAGTLTDTAILTSGNLGPTTNNGISLGSSTRFFSTGYLTNIELGHATDTTLTRTAAGRIAVEGVSIPLASDLIKSALSVSGMDNTGATSCNTALATLISTGGAWYFPDGDYMITLSGVNALRSQHLYILCSPKARFFSPTGANAVAGDLFNFDVPSDGAGLPTTGLVTVWQGGVFDLTNVKNSTSLPFSVEYPPANLGAAATGDGLSFRDEYLDGTWKNGSDRIEIRHATFNHGPHWESAGGDQGIFADGYRSLTVEGCTFIGSRDLGVYASGDATGATNGRTRIVNNTFTNCFFGAAVKRALKGFEISGNTFKGCVGGINVNEIVGTEPADGVIAGNDFEECGVWVRADYGRRLTIRDNSGRRFGAVDEGGAAVTVYDASAFRLNGATYCTVENNRCEGLSAAFSAINTFMLDAHNFTTAAAAVVTSQFNLFRRNVSVGLYSIGGEASGEADNNYFDECYNIGGTIENPVVFGAGTAVKRWDTTNSRPVHTTPLGFGDGTAAAPAMARATQTSTGVFFALNKVGFTTGGTERIAVTASGLEFGAATDATLARSGAGDLAIEGNVIHRVGGTDVAVADGGTGSSTARGAAANLGTWHVIYQSGVQVARNSVNGAGDATEETLVAVTIPAGAMGPNGSVRWRAQWSMTSSANVKTLRTRFGGVSGTLYHNTGPTTSVGYTEVRQIHNRNSESSQVGSGSATISGLGITAGTIATSSVATSAAVDLVFRCNWAGAVSAETIALEAVCVEVCYGA